MMGIKKVKTNIIEYSNFKFMMDSKVSLLRIVSSAETNTENMMIITSYKQGSNIVILPLEKYCL